MRLGFAVKVLGQEGLKDCDARRWQSSPHLRHSIGYLNDIFTYLDQNDLRMYRMSSDLAPYVTHPDLPDFHRQIDESAEELAALGERARKLDLRLSLHPSQYIVLNAADEGVAERSIAELISQGDILDAMGLGPEAVVVTHVGGVYGDRQASMERWSRRYEELPEKTRARLVLENDDVSYPARDVLAISKQCGVRVVFDTLHHFCNHNPGDDLTEMLQCSLATWPVGQIPKIHYSSPRTEAMSEPRKAGKASSMKGYGGAPDSRLHSDYINQFEFVTVLDQAVKMGRDFDVMIEAKAKDLAVIKLRKDLAKLDFSLNLPTT